MLLNKEGKSASELQKELDVIKAQNLNDKDINELISKVEDKIAAMGKTANIPLKDKIENAFQGIADAAKNNNISKPHKSSKKRCPVYRRGCTGADYHQPGRQHG